MLGRADTEYPGRTRRYAPSYHRAQWARPSKYKEGPRWAGEKLLFKPWERRRFTKNWKPQLVKPLPYTRRRNRLFAKQSTSYTQIVFTKDQHFHLNSSWFPKYIPYVLCKSWMCSLVIFNVYILKKITVNSKYFLFWITLFLS